jgi:hypothetical protein
LISEIRNIKLNWKNHLCAAFIFLIVLGPPFLLLQSNKTVGHETKSRNQNAGMDLGERNTEVRNSSRGNTIDRWYRNLKKTSIVFTAPSHMKIGKSYPLELLLNFNQSEQNQINGALEGLDQAQKVKIEKIKVTRKMIAVLNGEAFEIRVTDDEKRSIREQKSVVWKWNVSPIKFGTQTLDLTISAWIEDSGALAQPIVILTHHQEIKVTISPVRLFFFSLKKLLAGAKPGFKSP